MKKCKFCLQIILFCVTLLLLFTISVCTASNLPPAQHQDSIAEFNALSMRIQNLAKSEKALSILKLEYKIQNLPEFVVIRKLQSSILQTFYTAVDIGFVANCYPSLDFDNESKMEKFYHLFLGLVGSYNDSSNLTILLIESDLSRSNRYLEKQYPDFAAILSELKLDIASLRDNINDFVKDNIPDKYVSDYPAVENLLTKRKKEDIALAHADYIPPKSFLEHLSKAPKASRESKD